MPRKEPVSERLVERGTQRHDMVDALAGTGFDLQAATAQGKRDLRGAIDARLRRAQRARAVRADVSIDDIMSLLAGVSLSLRAVRGDAWRLTAIVCDGLRAR
jgi:hypothetical protein